MKLFSVLAMFFALTLSSALYAADAEAPAPAPAQQTQTVDEDPYYWTPPLGMLRGLTNAVTCPLELVRCVFLDGQGTPVLGLVEGLITGTCMTVYRALDGVCDVITFGYTGNYWHGDVFRTFVWESRWLKPDDRR